MEIRENERCVLAPFLLSGYHFLSSGYYRFYFLIITGAVLPLSKYHNKFGI